MLVLTQLSTDEIQAKPNNLEKFFSGALTQVYGANPTMKTRADSTEQLKINPEPFHLQWTQIWTTFHFNKFKKIIWTASFNHRLPKLSGNLNIL